MATFAPGDEVNMLSTISEYYQTLTTSTIFEEWKPLGLVSGINHLGMVNTAPLKEFVKKFFGEHSYDYKRKVAFGGVNAANGNYEVFNETLSDEDKINGIMTSSAIPFVFPSQHWTFNNEDLIGIDGGSVWNLNLVSAIQRCKEIVDDESKITVDVIDCFTYKAPDYTDEARKNTIENYLRYLELKSYNEGGAADVAEVMAAFPKVNFRHYVAPSQSLSLASVLDGTNSTCTWPM